MQPQDVSEVIKDPEQADPATGRIVGNVKLITDGQTVLVPTPSSDPNAYSCTSVVLVSGLGPIFSVILASYPGQEGKVNDLMTYPSLFMGIGNLVCMPLALALGRRPIFLFSILLLVATSVWCTFSRSLDSHITARDLMGFAAGQSEALAPMIIHEICFLHERGRKIAWFIFIENITCGVFFVVSTYMVNAWGWRWWYGFFAIANVVILVLSVVFVSETSFERSPEAMRGEAIEDISVQKNEMNVVHRETISVASAPLQPRSFLGHMALFQLKPQWNRIPFFYMHVVQGLCVPSILWLLLLNGAFLGMYIFQSSTFSTILLASPYHFAFTSLGYVQAGQIAICFIFLPALGYGSDYVIRIMTRRNNGQFKPEYRLLVVAAPSIVGVICAIIYGQAGSTPGRWAWSAVVMSYHGIFFAFIGANIVSITYAIDSFPLRSAALLVVICAGRGLVGFGLSYSVLPSVKALGYHGSMNVQAVVAAVLATITVPMYFAGPWIRLFAQRCFKMDR